MLHFTRESVDILGLETACLDDPDADDADAWLVVERDEKFAELALQQTFVSKTLYSNSKSEWLSRKNIFLAQRLSVHPRRSFAFFRKARLLYS